MVIRGLLPCRAVALGLLFLGGGSCGTAPATPASTAALPAVAAVAPPPPVVPPAPVALEFASPAAAEPALVASFVSVAPAKLIGDLDALSKRLELPMKLGQELLSSVAGLGLLGDRAHFQAVWDRVDANASLAVVWVLPPKAEARGFCLALTFRDAEGARKTFDELGTQGAQRNGVSARRAPTGDLLWGGTKGRTLFLSSSADALLLGGGLAEAAQAAPPTGQMMGTILPPALVAASGKSREAVMAEIGAMVANEARQNRGLPTPALQRLVAALMETAAKVVVDSSAVRLALEVGPGDGFWLRTELVPANGTDLAATTARRAPHAFDGKLPVRDDSTGVLAFGNLADWLSVLAKPFELSGPAGQEAWRSMSRLFAATGPWSCTVDPAEVGFGGLCSSALAPGITAKAALDAAVAMLKAQHGWEAALYDQKLAPLKIKRSGPVVEIEKKIETRDRLASAVTKALAGGDTVRTALTVKDGHLLQATGRDPRKMLTRYGTSAAGASPPLLGAALSRAKGAELFASLDVISMALRLLGKNKDLPGSAMAAVAAALPGVAEMKAPFVLTLRGGAAVTGELRLPLGSLDGVAKVVRGMLGPAGARPAQ